MVMETKTKKPGVIFGVHTLEGADSRVWFPGP